MNYRAARTAARTAFALFMSIGFLSACSGAGSGPQPLIPQDASKSTSVKPMSVLPPPPPVPTAFALLAGVDLTTTTSPQLAIFTLTSATACFGGGSGSSGHGHGDGDRHSDGSLRSAMDEGGDGDGGEHHHGHHHGHHHTTSVSMGNPYTPTSNVVMSFGAYTLTNPCASSNGSGGSGEGDDEHHHHNESGVRQSMAVLPTPAPPGWIVALDSTDPTKTLQVIESSSTSDGTTYTFQPLRFGHVFRVSHTYTFALAIAGTPSPSPEPTETPEPEHGD